MEKKTRLTPWSIDHDKVGGHGHLQKPALPRQRVHLSPSLGQGLSDIVGMQTHVHGVIRVVDMDNLALAIGSEGMLGKQGQPVLFHTRPLGAKLERTMALQLHHGPPQRLVAVSRAVLVQLSLGSYARHPRPRSRSIRQVLGAQDARLRSMADSEVGRRHKGITQSPQPPPRYLQVSVKGGRRAARPEAEKVLVVVVDEDKQRRQEDETFRETRTKVVDRHEQGCRDTEQAGSSESDGYRLLAQLAQRRRLQRYDVVFHRQSRPG